MSERVRLRNQLIETQGLIEIPRDRIAPIIETTQAARMNYEDACSEKYFYDLVMHFRAAIFGSARLKSHTKKYQFVSQLAKSLVESREIGIVTGGGSGIMEAANYELLYLMQLKQVGHLEKSFPIIVHPHWKKFLRSMNESFYYDQIMNPYLRKFLALFYKILGSNHVLEGDTPMIREADMKLVTISADIEKIVELISAEYDFWRKDIRDKVRFTTSEN